MPYLGSRAERFRKRIEIEGDGFVVVRRPSMKEAQAIADAAEADGQSSRPAVELVATLIVEWNLCQENGDLVGLDDRDAVIDTIMDLPADIATELFNWVIDSVRGRSGEDAQRFSHPGPGSTPGAPQPE